MKYIQYGTEFLDQLKDKVHEQQWEIERLKEELKREQDNSIYLEERINKAIEYIKELMDDNESAELMDISFYVKNELLNILQGVDKEWVKKKNKYIYICTLKTN